MNKRGEVTSNHIVVLVILIISFAVILFLYWQFNWNPDIDKQTCHESVILRASVPSLIDKKIIEPPLQCKTDKICISDKLIGKGDCDDDFAGESYRTIRIRGDLEEKKEEIMRVYADALADCWWMMGEGKIDIFSREPTLEEFETRCVICARIAIEKNLKQEITQINDFSKFLEQNKVPGKSLTYLQFLTASQRVKFDTTSNFEVIIPSIQQAIMFQQWSKSIFPETVGAVAGTVVGGVIGLILGKSFNIATVTASGGFFAGHYLGNYVGEIFIPGEKFAYSWKLIPYYTKTQNLNLYFLTDDYFEKKISTPIIYTSFSQFPKPITKPACISSIDLDKIKKEVPQDTFNLVFINRLRYGLTEDEELIYYDNIDKEYEVVAPSNNPNIILLYNKIKAELVAKCYDLSDLNCDSFEGYV